MKTLFTLITLILWANIAITFTESTNFTSDYFCVKEAPDTVVEEPPFLDTMYIGGSDHLHYYHDVSS